MNKYLALTRNEESWGVFGKACSLFQEAALLNFLHTIRFHFVLVKTSRNSELSLIPMCLWLQPLNKYILRKLIFIFRYWRNYGSRQRFAINVKCNNIINILRQIYYKTF